MEGGIIKVPSLLVQVVTGDTCYPGEDGFSAIYAEVTLDDADLQRELLRSQEGKLLITLRCAVLDVAGHITSYRTEDKTKTFVVAVKDLTYRKPGEPNKPLRVTRKPRP